MKMPCSKAELQLSKKFYKRRSWPRIFENSDNSRPTVFNCQAYHNIAFPPPPNIVVSPYIVWLLIILYFRQNETTKLRDQIVSSTDTCVTICIKRAFKWYPVTELNTIRVLPRQHYKNELTFMKIVLDIHCLCVP